MKISNFPNGFNNGLMVRGLPLTMAHPGQIFWVNNSGVLPYNGVGASNNNAGTYLAPFSTLNYAVTQCTASRGDIIMIMPGHAETISSATALALNKAGVAVVGLGKGTTRPTFTLDTATTTTIAVSAANISIVNCLFKANFAAIVALFTLSTAKYFNLQDCDFVDNSSILNFKWIVNVGTTANAADGLRIEDCKRMGAGATNATALVNMAGTNDNVVIKNNYVAHNATTDAGLMPIATGKVVTNLDVDNNVINLVGSAGATTGILITTDGTTNSGIVRRNFVQSLDATSEILVTASSGLIYSQNYYSGAADKSGYLLPAADA